MLAVVAAALFEKTHTTVFVPVDLAIMGVRVGDVDPFRDIERPTKRPIREINKLRDGTEIL